MYFRMFMTMKQLYRSLGWNGDNMSFSSVNTKKMKTFQKQTITIIQTQSN